MIANRYIKIMSLFLCIVLIFTISAAFPVTKSEAIEPVTLTAASAGTLIEILLIVGITVVTTDMVIKFIQAQNEQEQTGILDWLDEVGNRTDSNGKRPDQGGKHKL